MEDVVDARDPTVLNRRPTACIASRSFRYSGTMTATKKIIPPTYVIAATMCRNTDAR
jgi:hypothetical protein